MEIVKIVQDGIELDVGGSVDANSITQDADNRLVTDTEKNTWNNKQDKLTAGTNVNIKGTTISATDTIYDDTALKDRITAVEEREDKDTVTTVNGKTGAITKDDIVALGIPGQDTNTTYDVATTSKNGLMSSADKTKLNGVEAGAQKNTITSVQGRTGAVTVSKSDIGLGNVDNVKQMPISGGILENYREKLVTVAASSGSINLSLGNVFQHTPSGNVTYSITNAVSGQAHSFTLIINMGSTVRTLMFPSSVKWQGGEIPNMSTGNKSYVLTFMTVDGGTTWLSMFGGEF